MQTITTDKNGKVMIHENGRVREMSEREMLRHKFIMRASNPPVNCSEISAEWYNYVDEMRALEEQLKQVGEEF